MDQASKRRFLTTDRDLTQARGIEIGARDAPLVTKTDGPVRYADHADTATLRAALPPGIDPAALVEVDLVTAGGPLAPLVPDGADYVLASHVLEHVPDLIGWLADIHAVLAPGGTLGLAIPDKRFTFDRYRAESTIAEAVEAWLTRATRPSLRQIYDSCWLATDMTVPDAWATPPGPVPQSTEQRLRPAFDLVSDIARTPRYNDAHCWVFTPASFLGLMRRIAALGAFPFTVQRWAPTPPGGYEFLVVLRRAEDPADPAIPASLAQAEAETAASPGEAAWRALIEHSADTAALQAENAQLRAALHAMQSATLWRATAPLRALLTRLRR